MHYLLGLAALVMGAAIATRRTRPTWFVVLTAALVAVGALFAILSYTRVTDGLGLLPNSIIGWVFVGLSIITMLASIFVLERRGEHGEELPPLIGDNPFDGDTDDSDDPARGTARASEQGVTRGTERATAHGTARSAADDAAVASVTGAAASSGAAGAAAAGAPGYAGVGASGTEAYAEEIVMNPALPDDDTTSHPGPSEDAHDGTAVIGADPDIATAPAETDVDAAPEGDASDDQGTSHR